MTYSDLLKNIWQAVYAPEADTTAIIKQHFHPDYKQCINGIYLKRDEYIQHVLAHLRKERPIILAIDVSRSVFVTSRSVKFIVTLRI
jgi:hypothetical protein